MALRATLGALWPLRNIYNFIHADGTSESQCDEKGAYSGGKLRPYHDRLADYVAVFCGQLPKIAIAIMVWRHTVDMEAAAAGWDLSFPSGWVWAVVHRDLLLMALVPGVWDWLLYFSPLKAQLAPYKFNKKYPSWAQLRRDVFWTLSATLLASVQEVLVMRHWESVTGMSHSVRFFGTEQTPWLVLWTVTMLYWRISHFYWIHRAMHPWWDRKGGLHNGDIGAFLYRHVHAHHHKSYNPTAFSGISMTPVESVLYISAALIPICFRSGRHPWLHLYTKLDLIIGAQIGHDGFDVPGGGSYYHQLHHAHFECNYGDSAGIPWDWLMGTFEDGSSYSKREVAAVGATVKAQKAD